MSKKVYIIFKHRDEEDDHGEPYDVPTPVKAFVSEEDAKDYVKEHDKPYVYREQYGDYYTNHFDYTEVPLNEEDEPMSKPTEQFNKDELKCLRNSLYRDLREASAKDELMEYSRLLIKVDDLLKEYSEED